MNIDIKKAKILFFVQIPPPVHGVSEMNRLILANPFLSDKYITEVLPIRFSNSLSEIRKYTIYKLISFIKVYNSLKKELSVFKPDLVYFSFIAVGPGLFRDLLFLRLIRKSNAKIVLHLNNKGIRRNSKKIIYRILYKYTFHDLSVIHVSEKLANDEFIYTKLINCRIFIQPNTCDDLEIGKSLVNNSAFNILFISNLFPEKGVEIAIQAVYMICQRYPGIRLNIYGHFLRPNYKYKIDLLIKNMGLTENILMHGPADKALKETALVNADIFLLPTYFKEECMPVCILEAMQAGLPIVTSNIGAIPDMIKDSKNGILVEPENIKQLTDKLISLIEDQSLRKMLGREARRTFEEQYNYDNFKKSHIKIIDEILSL